MILAFLTLALSLPALQENGVDAPPPEKLAPAALTANADEPYGVLRFSMRHSAGPLMPGRLTFVREDDVSPDLFPGVDARPDNLAVRRNVVYCLSGEDAITVPVGEYTVYASRGIEWSLPLERITIVEGKETEWHPRLKSEVSTAGWISGDFHLHTLTHSGHGDANMKERVISLIGEGVEFAVATDHNHNTDYLPTLAELGASDEIKAVTGNEISTSIGHINAFPLNPESAVIDSTLTDANELFKLIREERDEHGTQPVIQLNHPRWEGIDIFTALDLDPVTGRSDSKAWSTNFDTIELLNENEGWGLFDAETSGDLVVGGGLHSVLQDWYNLLNLGVRCFAVGNSDSHTVHHSFAGYPRNYVQSSTDNPKLISTPEIADALRNGRSFISVGPFIDFKVNGQGLGEVVRATTERQGVTVKIKAPSWIYLHRVKIIVNGDLYRTIPIEPRVLKDGSIRWPTAKAVVTIHRDSWIHVIVEGDENLSPIVTGKRPILPVAISNPIWVQVDNDATQTSMWTWALGASGTRTSLQGLRPSEAAMVLQAGAEQNSPNMPQLVRSGFRFKERLVQLACLRAMEKLQLPGLNPILISTLTSPSDSYHALALCRTLKACGAKGSNERLLDLFERYGAKTMIRYESELEALVDGDPIRDWMVIGHFDSPEIETLFKGNLGPVTDPDTSIAYKGKNREISWSSASANGSGLLDLAVINAETAVSGISFAQTWLHVTEAREVLYSMGSDDGCMVWINGNEIYRDQSQHGVTPMQKIGRMQLNAGWNRLLVGVQNGGGASGLFFRMLSTDVTSAAQHL
ncbi:MAG: hypothetical protein ACI8X5_002668 [Planctomycetota bacterium]|jgi:hypothetical protein